MSAALTGRNKTLDGWRGIAILLVLWDHAAHSLFGRYPRFGRYLSNWAQTGQHGVTIFFVLSGFLITSKLIEGPINLRHFYIRRFFRLMPVAWAYLAFLVLLGHGSTSHLEIPSCLFFFRNFLGVLKTPFTGHFWSLSIEEQFYLIWPCVLILVGIRKARWFAVLAAVSCAIYRAANWNHYNNLGMNFRTEVRADALLVGCLVALLVTDDAFREATHQFSKWLVLPAICLLIFAVSHIAWLPPLYEDLSVALLMISSVNHPNAPPSQLISTSVLAWVGRISYSIYVWQAFFLLGWGKYLTPCMICVMPIFVLASYYGIEKPCTQLGRRLTGRSDLRRPPAEPSEFADTAPA